MTGFYCGCGLSARETKLYRVQRRGETEPIYICQIHAEPGDIVVGELDLVKRARPVFDGPMVIQTRIPASPPGEGMECPASMCPLVAPNGSPWTGEYAAACPGHDDYTKPEPHTGCPWWSAACSCGGIQGQVEEAALFGGRALVVGPNQPRRDDIGSSRTYDCPKADVCRWQEQATAKSGLCPPRDALSRGLDPRVCLF